MAADSPHSDCGMSGVKLVYTTVFKKLLNMQTLFPVQIAIKTVICLYG